MSDKLHKTIARFQLKIDNKDFYEAHQTLRTITNRYVKSHHYTEAIDLLYQGSSILAKNNEYASASDLATYLVNVYNESNTPCLSEPLLKEYKSKLIELISLLPDTDPSMGDLAKQAIGWSREHGENPKFGDSQLHHLFGVKLLNACGSQPTEDDRYRVFAVAELHLILGTYESLPVYVDYLYKWQEASEGDAGQFLARAVMNYAYLKNVKFVQAALDRFVGKYVADAGEKYEEVENMYLFEKLELMNFLQLLGATLGKANSSEKFMKLYSHFKGLLQENELLNAVEYLGRFYFGLKLGNPQGGNNMLANLMGGLFK